MRTEKFELSYSKVVVKTATQIATLKAEDEKLKLEEEYSHLKLWSMYNTSWELDSF